MNTGYVGAWNEVAGSGGRQYYFGCGGGEGCILEHPPICTNIPIGHHSCQRGLHQHFSLTDLFSFTSWRMSPHSIGCHKSYLPTCFGQPVLNKVCEVGSLAIIHVSESGGASRVWRSGGVFLITTRLLWNILPRKAGLAWSLSTICSNLEEFYWGCCDLVHCLKVLQKSFQLHHLIPSRLYHSWFWSMMSLMLLFDLMVTIDGKVGYKSFYWN